MRRPSRYTSPEFSDRNYRPARGTMPDDWREPDSPPSPEEEDPDIAGSPLIETPPRAGGDTPPQPPKRSGPRTGQFLTGGQEIPVRLCYPILESSYNKTGYDEALDRMGGSNSWYIPLWWDVN